MIHHISTEIGEGEGARWQVLVGQKYLYLTAEISEGSLTSFGILFARGSTRYLQYTWIKELFHHHQPELRTDPARN